MTQITIFVGVVAIAMILILVFWRLFFRRAKKHWLKDKTGKLLAGIKVVICEIEDTTFNKLTSASDGSIDFTFSTGWMIITIEDKRYKPVEIINHPEASFDGIDSAMFYVESRRESLTFVVDFCRHR